MIFVLVIYTTVISAMIKNFLFILNIAKIDTSKNLLKNVR